ncbi:uncharacterized protein LOC124635070 [Helicoverpa zea]|uniref:uncharacterized protein LOC124635070 n=1 Tax=Helicoverpa zea TaxID=7113 RepID=UPI001F58367C|nr:uncharacterized protein LOC124635070 [Helicoverpa zea]
MSLIQSIPDLLYVILFVISLSYLTYASPPEGTDVTEAPKQRGFFHYLMQAFLERVDLNKIEGRNNNGRVKRQSSAGKLQDAAKMPGSKILMLMLSMISNMFTTDPVGGVHPMSPQNARPVVKLFKEKIIGFLFPKPGKAQN